MTLRSAAKSAHNLVVSTVLAPVLKHELRVASQQALNERPAEYRYALEQLAAVGASSVLDVGSGLTAWPALLANCGYRVQAVDEGRSYWVGGPKTFFNRHYLIQHDDITNPSPALGPFDAVTCLSVLEHIPDHEAAMRGMFTLLRPGGHLILTGPWNETRYVEDAYQLPEATYGQGAEFICRMYSRDQLDAWLERNDGELVNQEWYKVFTGPLWAQGERVRPPVRVDRDELHHLSCLTLRKR